MNVVLIEGRPGSGKTTAALAVLRILRAGGVDVGGFTTEEIRAGGRRVGFAVEDCHGRRATLAHIDISGPPKVGRYGVDLAAFEDIAVPALQRSAEVFVIDELGKMELASNSFVTAVDQVLASGKPVVATVHMFRHAFTDDLKSRFGTMPINRSNRDKLPLRAVAGLGMASTAD
jgi:nucleoside-triphosphatase